jgi:hypothetical protein
MLPSFARSLLTFYIWENKLKPENGGSESGLNDEQTVKFLAHLDEQVYVDVKDRSFIFS